MKSCQLTSLTRLSDMCIEALGVVNKNIWYYRENAEAYKNRISECRRAVGDFAETWNKRTDLECSDLKPSWMEVLRNETFTSRTRQGQDQSKILGIFETDFDISSYCEGANCPRDKDVLSAGFQSHGILLAAALLAIFLAIFIRGKRSRRNTLEEHHKNFALTKNSFSSRDDTVFVA